MHHFELRINLLFLVTEEPTLVDMHNSRNVAKPLLSPDHRPAKTLFE